jgi:hypothetical protein
VEKEKENPAAAAAAETRLAVGRLPPELRFGRKRRERERKKERERKGKRKRTEPQQKRDRQSVGRGLACSLTITITIANPTVLKKGVCSNFVPGQARVLSMPPIDLPLRAC